MYKQCDLRNVFENYVSRMFKKGSCVDTCLGRLPVLTWLITLDEHTRKIHLNAVTRSGLVSVACSYPFGTITNAYRFMVRL